MAGHSDAHLFTALARAAERQLGSFKAQELANTAWAFAKGVQANAYLFTVFARAARQNVGDFDEQNLANTA